MALEEGTGSSFQRTRSGWFALCMYWQHNICASEPLPKTVNITYYLTIFSEAEMKKSEKQWKPNNTFLQTKFDHEWDTIKVQLLEKTSQSLCPRVINFNDYSFSWSVPRYQPLQMQLRTSDDYQFLITHALKPKEPAVNIRIETKPTKVCIWLYFLYICMK